MKTDRAGNCFDLLHFWPVKYTLMYTPINFLEQFRVTCAFGDSNTLMWVETTSQEACQEIWVKRLWSFDHFTWTITISVAHFHYRITVLATTDCHPLPSITTVSLDTFMVTAKSIIIWKNSYSMRIVFLDWTEKIVSWRYHGVK